MTRIFKEKDRDIAEHDGPVSILPNVPKIYKMYMYNQMYKYPQKSSFKMASLVYQSYSLQHCLHVIVMWPSNCKTCLLWTRLQFFTNDATLLKKTKNKTWWCVWCVFWNFVGVSQSSTIGSLLFNIWNMFYYISNCDIASYTDDNTTSASSSNLNMVIPNIQTKVNYVE